jgi:hypothetical protein
MEMLAMAAINESRLLVHNRSEGANFDLFDDPSIADVYVDGIGQINIGNSVSRLKFYTVKNIATEESGPVEERVLSHSLVISTPQLLNLVINVIGSVSQGKQALNDYAEQVKAQIDNLPTIQS